MLRLFKGTCNAIRAMHHYHAPIGPPQTDSQQEQPSRRQRSQEGSGRHSDDERFPAPEGDSEGGYSYGPNIPLMTKQREEEHDVVFDRDEELAQNEPQTSGADPSNFQLVPYAHRDIKPGYVPVSDSRLRVLSSRMTSQERNDSRRWRCYPYGLWQYSKSKSRCSISVTGFNTTGDVSSSGIDQVAVFIPCTAQDLAAEQSTMAYRAPELFDVKTGVSLDEKVDIWVRRICTSRF
jgi:serine/threonine kinase 16